MISQEEKDKLRSVVYRSASLSRVLGMITAFLEGKRNCTIRWIYGQITKAHNVDEARIVLDAFNDELITINPSKMTQLRYCLKI